MSAKNHTILHVLTKKEKINKIYKLAKDDLYVNGGHSILVDTLHLFSFKTPIIDDKIRKNVKSIVGISPTMV